MMSELQVYLTDLGRRLHLSPAEEREILRELQAHVEERAQELCEEEGLSPQEALHRAVQATGMPQELARQMYSVHSRASWRDALLAAAPHMAVASLFAMHLWTKVTWTALVLALASLVAIQGWRRSKSSWFYPWLSYSLALLIFSGAVALGAIGYGIWSLTQEGTAPLGIPLYLLLAIYCPFALWLGGTMVTRVIRRDWLLASLTVMPFPLLLSWLLYVEDRGKPLTEGSQQLHASDNNTALVFLALAITTAIFLRVGKRMLRILLIIAATPLLTFFGYLTYLGNPSALTAAVVASMSLAVLLLPLLLELRFDHHSWPAVGP